MMDPVVYGVPPSPFGWVPPEDRTPAMHEADERARSLALPSLQLEGTYHETTGRFALWKALQIVLAGKLNDPQVLPFNHQVTGSCVGAGWGNMQKVHMAVEITQGELEEWRHLWWPYTYGRGRYRGGMRSPGEGSFGTAQAEAAVQDGSLAIDEAQGLPAFRDVEGWLQLDRSTEMKWSDGDASHALELAPVTKLHLFKSYTVLRDSSEVKAAHANGYAVTCASMFGTRGPRRQGNPEVNLAEWDDRWAHQMSVLESWDHPSLGLIHLIMNNWGKRAHPAPTQGEPWGGFYVTAKTMDRICQDREVIAFSGYSGFRVRELDYFV